MKKFLSLLTFSVAGLTMIGSSAQLVSSFVNNYNRELQAKDISDVKIKNPKTMADPNSTYGDLNNTLKLSVLNEIMKQEQVLVFGNDFTISNDQDASARQEMGQKVTFTVVANPSSSRIRGQFTFVDKLGTNDISDVKIDNPMTIVNPEMNYSDLDTNSDLVSLIIKSIDDAKKIAVNSSDFTIKNDQKAGDYQTSGTTVKIDVVANDDSKLIQGEFSFIDTLQKADISNTKINNLDITADPGKDFSDLNNNKDLINAVLKGINGLIKFNVSIDDLIISNDQTGNQKPSAKVTFTVKSNDSAKEIKGQFQFFITLGKVDISLVNINDPQTKVTNNQTYGDLNNSLEILGLVINKISNQTGIILDDNDIVVTNDQDAKAMQEAGTKVNITVTANSESQQVKGQFHFIDTLAENKADISDVTINDIKSPADIKATYGDLNTNSYILNDVAAAINEAKATDIDSSEFTISNNQDAKAMQKEGTQVTFTVVAKDSSKEIFGSFTFVDTLNRIVIDGITIKDPQTHAEFDQTYSQLNSDIDVMNIIINTIDNSTGVLINDNDITVSNDQNPTAKQEEGTKVTFTVNANAESTQLVGSFKFTDTLQQKRKDISTITVADPKTAVSANMTYNDLNSNNAIVDSVINAVKSTLDIEINSDDFTITNDQNPQNLITPGVVVTLKVTANDSSQLIFGSFTFVDTIAKQNIDNIKVGEMRTSANPTQTYVFLNINQELINNLLFEINNDLNININLNDIVLTNDQDPNANQAVGTKVTFTVAARASSSLITGSFTFTDILF